MHRYEENYQRGRAIVRGRGRGRPRGSWWRLPSPPFLRESRSRFRLDPAPRYHRLDRSPYQITRGTARLQRVFSPVQARRAYNPPLIARTSRPSRIALIARPIPRAILTGVPAKLRRCKTKGKNGTGNGDGARNGLARSGSGFSDGICSDAICDGNTGPGM